MREREAELEAHGARVFAVTFESASRVREYRERESTPFPILRDPRRAGYQAFGIERRDNAMSLWRPKTFWYYVKSTLRGKLPKVARVDHYQLGGDVLLSSTGEVCWVYRSEEPADRPSINKVIEELDGCQRD